MPRVLIVDREEAARALIERRLGDDLTIESATNVHAALDDHSRKSYDVVVWNTVSTPSECFSPLRIVKKFLKDHAGTRAIVLSDVKEPEIIGMRGLPCEWLKQPVDETELLALIENTVRSKALDQNIPTETTELIVPVEFEGILAFTLKMRSVIQYIMEAAAADIPVLITGETGTGKDLVAAAIHKRSKRNDFPYLPVNMGAIAPELIASELFGHERGAYTGASEKRTGLFEQAQGGTIFLDEITTMDEKTQVSLLRVLETKTIRRVRGDKDISVDVRVIAATNENIEPAVQARRFREDLFYRLDVFRIQLPPLRERHGAISLLTDHFVARFAELYKKEIRVVSREAYRLIRGYPWPGNIRELKNVIQRAVLLAKGAELTPDLLPQRIREADGLENRGSIEQPPIHLGMSLGEVEKEYIKMTLASVNGNKMKAASALGISRRALYNKLKRFGML
jgi:DNA-binding NtrC family response regulator